ncbi:MAG: TolC family protein [Deltaproteobacteria bacterium]|nr:TolC family protein [Deltaproteobacteria bacterium]
MELSETDVGIDAAETAGDVGGPEEFPDFADVSAHPGIRQADSTVKLSESNRLLAVSDVLPRFNFLFDYQWEANDTLELDGDEQWTATLALEIPIFQGLTGAFGIAQSQKQFLAAKLRRDDFRRAFLQRAYSAQLNMRSATQRVVAAQKELAFAKENLDVVDARRQIGAASNLDLLDAQFSYIRAKSRAVTATADLQIARAEWEYVRTQ